MTPQPFPWFLRLCLALSATGFSGPAWAGDESLTLANRRTAGALDRVEVTLEVGGDLLVAEGVGSSDGKSTNVKMSAVANLEYDESTIRIAAAGAADSTRSVRYYDRAEAVIKVGDDGARPRLRDDRRLVAVELNEMKAALFCPRGLLTREELDLVDLLGNSLVLDQLLPAEPVKVGHSWKHPAPAIAALCGLDSVRSCDVTSEVKESDGDLVKFEMSGQAEGVITGLSTKLDIKAKYRFDRKRGRISWLGLLIKEVRKSGPMGPGLDVVAKLQVKIGAKEQSPQLTAASLKSVAWDPSPERSRVSYRSPSGRWQLEHDRRWVVINERNEDAVLRIATDGKYLAQCSIAAPGKTDAAKPPTLAEFQSDIRRALEKHFGQFVMARESTEENGDRVFRVAAEGRVSEVPIQWIYYRISDRDGRHALFAFTLESEALERFARLDEELTRGLKFIEPEAAK